MPMGIVSNDDFEKECNDSLVSREKPSTSEKVKIEIEEIQRGRGNKKEVPEEIRQLAAMSSINGEGTGAEIARAFGVSPSSVSAYKVGATSTTSYNNPDSSLLDTVINHKANISKKARNRLMRALNNITPQKLENVKARDLAAIAKDMSAIINDMEPPSNQVSQQNNVQFVFMAPRVKEIEDYKVIDVGD